MMAHIRMAKEKAVQRSATRKAEGDYFLAASMFLKARSGNIREGWCDRFVTLTPKRLYYYKAEENDLLHELRGDVPLEAIEGVTVSESKEIGFYRICVDFPSYALGGLFGSHKLIFFTKDKEQADHWSQIIEGAAKQAREFTAQKKKNSSSRSLDSNNSNHFDQTPQRHRRDSLSASLLDLAPYLPQLEQAQAGTRRLEAHLNGMPELQPLALLWGAGIALSVVFQVREWSTLLLLLLLSGLVPVLVFFFFNQDLARLRTEVRRMLGTHKALHNSLSTALTSLTSEDGTVPEVNGVLKMVPTVAWQGAAGSDEPSSYEQPPLCSLSDAPGARFPLRSMRGAKKEVNDDPLYTCVFGEVVQKLDGVLEDAGSRYAASIPFLEGVTPDTLAGTGLPRLVVVNMQIPVKNSTGYSIVLVFHVKPSTIAEAENIPAAKLLARFVEAASTESPTTSQMTAWADADLRRRFKITSYLDNVDDQHFDTVTRSLVKRFNGKPIILFKSGAGRVMPKPEAADEGPDYIECLDAVMQVRNFASLTFRYLPSMLQRLPNMLVSAGFLIQGEKDDELPERLVGAVQLHRIDTSRITVVE